MYLNNDHRELCCLTMATLCVGSLLYKLTHCMAICLVICIISVAPSSLAAYSLRPLSLVYKVWLCMLNSSNRGSGRGSERGSDRDMFTPSTPSLPLRRSKIDLKVVQYA